MNVMRRQVYYFEDLELGMEASFAKTVTAADILAFAEITGDWNPVHLDTEYAAKTVFREPIAHGMLTAGYISAVFGSQMPGPGAIYVFGDPRTIALSGRRQAIAVNGWSWESYSSRQWAALPAQLAAAAPTYVGIEPMYEPLLRERTPDLWNWLEANYRRVKSGKERSWYERTTPGPAVPAGN